MPRKFARFRPLISISLVLVTLALCAPLSAARKAQAGDKYKSPTGLFTILVPGVCSPSAVPYEVGQTAKTSGHEAWEEAWFYIRDVGELYRVGVFRLSVELRRRVETAEGPLSLRSLSWLGVRMHLGKRESQTGKWRAVSELEPVKTTYGSGVLSVNEVDGGRFLETQGRPNKAPDPGRAAVVVVLVVQRGEDFIVVSGQADAYIETGRARTSAVNSRGAAMFEPAGQTSEPACLITEVRKIADGMSLAPHAVGAR
jgi:hypothetical protein